MVFEPNTDDVLVCLLTQKGALKERVHRFWEHRLVSTFALRELNVVRLESRPISTLMQENGQHQAGQADPTADRLLSGTPDSHFLKNRVFLTLALKQSQRQIISPNWVSMETGLTL